jgi:prepilin-type N-terminal cleavage/methylation domain-containing protein
MVSEIVTEFPEVGMVKLSGQKGFSLIELLIVVVVIGVVAALAVPAFQKGIRAAENGSAFAVMRSISSSQVMFFSQNNRFAKLGELQQMMGNGIGVTTGDTVVRGPYVFELTTPEAQLGTTYVITATRTTVNETVYKYELNQSGKIRRILPAGGPED